MITTPVKLWRRQKNVALLIGARGKILNWTIVRVPTKSFAPEAPYPVVIVELENKEKMVGQLVDWKEKDLRKNKKVTAVLRKSFPQDKESVIAYRIKFRPHEEN